MEMEMERLIDDWSNQGQWGLASKQRRESKTESETEGRKRERERERRMRGGEPRSPGGVQRHIRSMRWSPPSRCDAMRCDERCEMVPVRVDALGGNCRLLFRALLLIGLSRVSPFVASFCLIPLSLALFSFFASAGFQRCASVQPGTEFSPPRGLRVGESVRRTSPHLARLLPRGDSAFLACLGGWTVESAAPQPVPQGAAIRVAFLLPLSKAGRMLGFGVTAAVNLVSGGFPVEPGARSCKNE